MTLGWKRALGVVIGVLSLGAVPSAAAEPLLPELEQLPPTELAITPYPGAGASATTYLLSFDSYIANGGGSGVGPLILRARRASTTDPMVTNQAILQTDGSEQMRFGIGELIYEVSSSHHHWHYKGFDRYELRRASDLKKVAPDNKAGFCLPDVLFTPDYCGEENPYALAVDQGMSLGFVDRYRANVEGQNVDVTGVRPGLYYLSHWVNSDSSLCEARFDNNVSAALIRLWPAGYGKPPYYSLLAEVERFSPPERQPEPSNCPWKVDRKAPRLKVRAPGRQLGWRARGVAASARCSELCTLTLSARLIVGRRASKLTRLRASLPAGKLVRLRDALTRRQVRSVRRALRKKKSAHIRLTLRARDRLGNAARAQRLPIVLR
jgi:Lysyl oxidase